MELLQSFLNTTAIGLVSLILFSLFIYRHFKSSSNGKEPPTVAGAWPVLGHLPLLGGSTQLHKTLGALADKYGSLFIIKLGSKKALVIDNWEIAKECFTKHDILISSRPKLIAGEQMGYNYAMFGLGHYGPYYREVRKIITSELLSSRRVVKLQHVFVSEVQNSIKELFDAWCNKKNESGYALVELKQWFSHLSYNIILKMVLGKRFFSDGVAVDEKAERTVNAVKEFLRLFMVFMVGDTIPYLRWFDFGGHEKAMKETAKEMDSIANEWLEEHRKHRTLDENDDGVQDFMDVMISLLDGEKLDGIHADTVIKSTVLGLIMEASETNSIMLTWAIADILRNPLIFEKVKVELDLQVGKENFICEHDISKLIYLQAIVKETLRLHNPNPVSLPREFTENCTLSGYNIKKGTQLMINVRKIHTDGNVWSDPFEFKPERFLTTHKDIDIWGQHFELLPFGSGRRICPGISFALQVVHLTLASLLHSFEILNPSSEPVDMSENFGMISSKATPLEVLIKPRLPYSYYEIM